jgi:ribonuclease HI
VNRMVVKTKFYVVWKGRQTGIFSSWEACARQVQGFTGAQYKSFSTRRAAEQAFKGKYAAHVGTSASGKDWLFVPTPPITESVVVDAACSGRTGRLEYRGLDLKSGKELFRQGPFENGTNNIGEFLAIAHAAEMLSKKGSKSPIYSDSATAIIWVRAKRCNTRLSPDKTNTPLFELIDRTEKWLQEHKIINPILKWDTRAWGEIPADFNRK